MNLILLQHDYPILSLSRLSAPVVEIEIPITDIRVYEGIEGVMEEIEEPVVGDMVEEQEMVGAIMEDDIPLTSDIVDEEDLEGVLVEEEPMDGVFEDC